VRRVATIRRPRALVGLAVLTALALAAPPAAATEGVRPAGVDIPIVAPARQPAVAVGVDGGFVVAWTAPEGEGGAAVWAQRFAADDRPLTNAFRVGTYRESPIVLRGGPAVGLAADGSFVVAWSSPGNTPTKTGIVVRRYAPGGAPRGPAMRASLDADAAGARLAVAADGRFVVGWTARAVGDSVVDGFFRIYGPLGAPLTGPTLAHSYTDFEQELSDLAWAPDGRIAAAIDIFGGEARFHDVFLSLFDGVGNPLVFDVQVNGEAFQATTQNQSRVVPLADGRWLVVFFGAGQDGSNPPVGGVVGRLLSAVGQPLGDDLVLNEVAPRNQHAPVAAPLPDGGFTVLWQDTCESTDFFADGAACALAENHRDGSLDGIFGRSFDAAGVPLAGDFRVNTEVHGEQATPALALAANAAGDLVAAWITADPPVSVLGQGALSARRLTAPCAADEHALCLGEGRFRAEVEWADFFGNSGHGVTSASVDLWGTFWFFHPANLEVAVKLIDGRAANGHWWLFSASLSNVEYTLRVTDTASGRVATYHNPSGTFASRGDTTAFADVGGFADVAGFADTTGLAGLAVAAHPVAHAAAAAPAAAEAPGPCQPAADRLCLAGGRFAVTIAWQDFTGGSGHGLRLPLTDDTGAFWFFRDDNPEVVVKVLDARAVNGHFWVFYGALTNVAFRLEVTDTATGAQRVYENPSGHFASLGDAAAFPPPGAAPSGD